MAARSLSGRLSPQELQRHVGRRVRLELEPDCPLGQSLVGTLVGAIEALDGLVAVVEPEGRPGSRVSCHYHYIRAIAPL